MPVEEQTNPNQNRPFTQTAKQQWDYFKRQSTLTLSNTALPGILAQFKAQILKYKNIIIFSFAGIALFILVYVGLNIGLSLGQSTKTPEITPPPLPSFTPTPSPIITSSFDQIYTDLNAFSSLLPDPAPPAVDPNITLKQSAN